MSMLRTQPTLYHSRPHHPTRVHKRRYPRDLDPGHKDTPGDTFWLAGIYFLVHAIFVAGKLWIWQQFN